MKLTEAQWHRILEIHRRARTVPNLGIFNVFNSRHNSMCFDIDQYKTSIQLNTAQDRITEIHRPAGLRASRPAIGLGGGREAFTI